MAKWTVEEIQMYYQPIAIILGSDNKPAKLRLISNEMGLGGGYNLRHFWLHDSDCAMLIQGDTVSKAVKKQGSTWVFPTYNRLPVLDMYENMVEDGVVVFGRDATFLTKFDPPENGDFKASLRVADARGRVLLYDQNKLLSIARRDKKRKLFCNVDYSRLEIDGFGSNTYSTAFTISEVSSDVDLIASQMLSSNIKFDFGRISVGANFSDSEEFIIPDIWTSVTASNLRSEKLQTLVCPKRMVRFSLQAYNCTNLETIVLPEYINDSLHLMLVGCPNIRRIVLPKNAGKGITIITLSRLLHLERITQYNSDKLSGEISLSLSDCPELTVLDTPNYDYTSCALGNCPVNKVVCNRMKSVARGTSILGRNPFIYENAVSKGVKL